MSQGPDGRQQIRMVALECAVRTVGPMRDTENEFLAEERQKRIFEVASRYQRWIIDSEVPRAFS